MRMRIPVLVGIFLVSGFLAVGNNLFNNRRVDWVGSAEVLPKPEGWPSLSAAQGIAGGAKVAWKFTLGHPGIVGGGVVSLALLLVASRRRHKPVSQGVKTWLRMVLGLMFLFAAYPKFMDPKGFAMLVTQYRFLPEFAVNGFSLALPAFEIVAGLALLFTPFEAEASAAVLLLLFMFIVALAQALARNLGIACGCFDIEGAADAGETWFSLLRDVVLLIPAGWMWLKSERRFPWHF